MNTKVVYTIVSSSSDFYLEQALLSVHSLRMYNPEAVVELVVDESTAATIEGKRAKIREYVNKIHVVETPEGLNSVHRSRFLKTNLREFVQGDYLFIDCDTVICDSLAGIDKVDAEIAMVADLNGELLLQDYNTIEKYKTAGFGDATGLPYFNSGVIYAKDTPDVHLFYKKWHTNWKESIIRGVHYDQPALCATNVASGKMIHELDGIWNCQFKFGGYRILNQAKILHYLGWNMAELHHFHHNYIFVRIKDNGYIDKTIEGVLCNAKTVFYTAMTVDADRASDYYFSELLYWYVNRPSLMRYVLKVIRSLSKIIY